MGGVLGIDIGGSGIKAAPVDTSTGELLSERIRVPTPEGGRPDEMIEIIIDLARRCGSEAGVGCGFPGVITRGVVRTAANLDPDWVGRDLAAELAERLGTTVRVGNDADVAGVAEIEFGVGRHRPEADRGVVAFFTLGTGIGSAIFVDGVLLPNTELGHVEIDGHDAESRAAASVRKADKLSWSAWAARLDVFFGRIEALLHPDLIIVGGGVSRRAGKWIPLLDTDVEVLPAELENQAGVVGAALLVGARRGRPDSTTPRSELNPGP